VQFFGQPCTRIYWNTFLLNTFDIQLQPMQKGVLLFRFMSFFPIDHTASFAIINGLPHRRTMRWRNFRYTSVPAVDTRSHTNYYCMLSAPCTYSQSSANTWPIEPGTTEAIAFASFRLAIILFRLCRLQERWSKLIFKKNPSTGLSIQTKCFSFNGLGNPT